MPKSKRSKRRLQKRNLDVATMARDIAGGRGYVEAAHKVVKTARALWEHTRATREQRSKLMSAIREHDRVAQEAQIANSEGRRKLPAASRGKSTKTSSKIMAVQGKSGPAIPRATKKRARPTRSQKKGFVFVNEQRATATDPDCVYVGHGVPINQVCRGICRVVIFEIFKKAGFIIEDWQQNIPKKSTQCYELNYYYYSTASSTAVSSGTVRFGGTETNGSVYTTTTYEQCVSAFFGDIDNLFTTASTIPVFQRFELIEGATTDVAATVGPAIAEIFADNLYVHVEFKSKLICQNVTQAAGGTGDAKLYIDRIDTNPVRGRKFETIKWANTIFPKNRNEATIASYGALQCDRDNGVFGTTASALGPTQSTTTTALVYNNWKKVPYGSVFKNVKASPTFELQPGEIRTDTLFFKSHSKWQTLVEKVWTQLQDFGTTYYVDYGKVSVLAFELKLQDSSDSNVTMNFENSWTLGMSSTYKRTYSVPQIRVN